MRVLYLEDSPSDVDLTRHALHNSAPDIHLHVVGSVAGALALLDDFQAAMSRGESTRFDLALLDLNLPDGSGLNVLAEVRHRALPLAVVVLTGKGDEQTVLGALRAGADDYLAKRHDYWTALAPTLRAALTRFRSQSARRTRPLRLLYAEPNEHDVALTHRHLATYAPLVRLEVVGTADEVLSRLPLSGAVADVDVVLLDYRMPGMDALEALKEIFDVRGLDVPVILTTGHGNEAVALEALKLGAADYIVKSPGYLYQLPNAVENAFHRVLAAREHAALRASDERFRAFQDASPVSARIISAQGRITYANRAYLANMGLSADEVIGKTLFELFPESRAREYMAAVARVLQSDGIDHTEEAVPFADGKLHVMSAYRFPVNDARGTRSIGGMSIDVTERRQAEESLRLSQERFEIVVRATNDVVWDWDLVHDTIWWNANFFTAYGFRLEDIEPDAASWTTRIHPDDRNRILEGIHRIIDGSGNSWSDDYRFLRADGSFAEIFDRGFVVRDASGKGVRMIGAMQDVTERKQADIRIRESEAKYRGLIEQASDGIFITDARGHYQLVNSRACELLGYVESEMIGMHGGMTHLDEDQDRYTGRLQEVAEGHALRYERMMKRKDGSMFSADISAKKIGDDAVQFIFRDITERKQAEGLLRESEARFRSFVEQSPDAMIIHQAGSIVFVNAAMVRLMRARNDGVLLGKTATSVVQTASAGVAEQRIARLYSGQPVPLSEQVYVRSDGTTVAVEVASSPIVLDGKPAALVTVRDITDRQNQERKIARLSRIQAVLSGINSAIVRIRTRRELFQEACRIIVEHGRFNLGWIAVLDHASGKVTAVAQAGLPENSGVGSEFFNGSFGLVPAGVAEIVLREKRSAFNNVIDDAPGVMGDEHGRDSLKVRQAAIELGAKSVIVLPLIVEGKMFGMLTLYAPERDFFDDEEVKLLDELAGDISFGLEFIAKEEKVDYLAYYDALTGLPNRSLFFDRLTHQLGSAARENSNVALVLINLDRFRLVNDTLGRQAGDALLNALAQRIKDTFRAEDTVARVGADSFAVAVSGTWQATDAARFLESHNRQLFGQPFVLGKEELRISATSGVAVFPGDGNNPEVLFGNAEAALRKSKEQNARFLFYRPEMNARIADSLRMENRLRLALENGEMVLWYQPKVNVRTRKITGFEALMRWNDPETGMVAPAKFIPLMEQTGLILEAGRWALTQVANDCRQWGTNGIKPPRVAVNVSPIQLRQKDFVATVVTAARETEEAGSTLDLEITESVIMENVEAIIPMLETIRGLGVEIAVDDFGTGYSSLAYIARLPIHDLKIDRSFIVGMTQSEDSFPIVKSVISLAHSLRLNVIAEGVETEEQAALLLQLDCDQMQGYLISKPAPPEQVPDLIRRHQPANGRG